MVLLSITASLFVTVPLLAAAQLQPSGGTPFDPCSVNPLSWDCLLEHDQTARSLLVYCNVTGLSQTECGNKFFKKKKAYLGGGSVLPSTVALEAAAICLERNNLNEINVFQELFKVDMLSISHYAQGLDTSQPRLDYHAGPDGDLYRQGYTEADRRAAGEKRRDTLEREQIFLWKMVEAGLEIKASDYGPLGTAIAHAIAISAELIRDKYNEQEGYNNPWREGYQPTGTCGIDTSCHDKDGNTFPNTDPPVVPDVPTSKPSPQPSSPSPTPTPPPIFPEGSDPSDYEPILAGEAYIDDEIIATPILQDETIKTDLQRCVKKEEHKLWNLIGSQTTDPEAQDDKDHAAQAELLQRMGVCDTNYFGREACRAWKQTLDTVPIDPEDEKASVLLLSAFNICPENLITPGDCHAAKQELLKRYIVPDPVIDRLGELYQPGSKVDSVPRLLDFSSSGGKLTVSGGVVHS
ncbi:hypothetical protein N7530_009742 [Penicillium desertorum]|uniref:Uncharacterized protein n=1 Tax=Penicillium desertorum TaxID=1303715 RepID=A0A9X0BID6_9EURO|nr:hypothetical protein N7530_009742 [Penicillium desertorum]